MVAATCSVRTLSRLPHAPCPCHLAALLFHPPCPSLTAHASLTPHVFSQKPSRSTPGDRRGLSSGSRLQVPLTAVHLSDGRSWPAMGIRPAARRVAGCASPAPRAPTRVPVSQKPAGGSRARAPMPARTPSAAAGEPPSPSERAPATCGERALSFGVAGVHRAVCSHARRDGRHAPDRRSATLESSTRSPARGAPMSAFPCSPSFQLKEASRRSVSFTVSPDRFSHQA